VRVHESGHVVVGLRGYSYGAGVTLGPVGLEGHAGIRLVDLHFGNDGFGGRGFGLGGLTPSTGASASIRLGPMRVGVGAFSEYAYRWFSSRPAEPLWGFTLDLAFGGQPLGLPAPYELGPTVKPTSVVREK